MPVYRKTRTWRGYLAYEIGNDKFGTYNIPLLAADYPPDLQWEIEWSAENFHMSNLGQKDKYGNELFLLSKGQEDGKILLLIRTPPGEDGIVDFRVYGDCEIIAKAAVAVQCCSVGWHGAVLVHGHCRIEVKRTGRILSSYPSQICANYDGRKWVLDYDIDFRPFGGNTFEI